MFVYLLLGCLTLLLTNPIWVVKTRLCLKDVDTLPEHMRYRNFRDGIYKLSRYEGLPGMYKVMRLYCVLNYSVAIGSSPWDCGCVSWSRTICDI